MSHSATSFHLPLSCRQHKLDNLAHFGDRQSLGQIPKELLETWPSKSRLDLRMICPHDSPEHQLWRMCVCLYLHMCVLSRQTLLLPKSFLHLGSHKSHIPFMLVGFLGGSGVKNLMQCRRCGFNPWVGTIPWRKKCQPTPVFLWENPMDRGGCQVIAHRIAKSHKCLSSFMLVFNVSM